MDGPRLPALTTAKVLVVEANFLLAEDMRSAVGWANGQVLGPASSVEQALCLIEHERPDAAVLGVDLAGHTTTPVAERLMELQVPFVVTSGYPRHAIPAILSGAPYLAKPFFREELVEALAGAIASKAAMR
jgi:two-component SAPR family response regulator